jgi:hypothetical protein
MYMVSVTLSVSKETRELMKKFSEINWSAFIRKSIETKVKHLSWKEEMTKKLNEEETLSNWMINKQKESREQRLQELKKKGLI